MRHSNEDLSRGHYPPIAVKDNTPDIRLQRTYLDNDGYHLAEIICYACNLWSAADEQQHKDLQDTMNWIWSGNDDQLLQTNDKETQLFLHHNYGKTRLLFK